MKHAHSRRMKRPVHPGLFVKTEIIDALEVSVTDPARVLGVTRTALSALLNARRAVTGDSAAP